jgi:hypothetical protein
MKRLAKYRKDTIIFFVEALFVIPFLAGLTLSCAHSVDYLTLHDTDTVIHRDTLHPDGPAFIRFLSVTDNKGTISLKSSATATSPWLVGLPQMDLQYVPIKSDSSFTLYAEFTVGPFPGTTHRDSIVILGDSLKPFSLNTVVVFQTRDTRLVPIFANDSLKKTPSDLGKCYIRFVNGLPDFPQPTPSVFLHLDNAEGTPIFTDAGGVDAPLPYQSLRNYVQITAGAHTIYARSVNSANDVYSRSLNFEAGKYYTARLVGLKADGTDQFVIDAE